MPGRRNPITIPQLYTNENRPSLEGDLLKLSTFGGPDGIRTRDLGLDRAACLAATPRDQAQTSLPYGVYQVKPGRFCDILTSVICKPVIITHSPSGAIE
jgi:hypothetical protein